MPASCSQRPRPTRPSSRRPGEPVPVWVGLLRGVNLGARNQVNMPRLRQVLAGACFGEVRTYVQSGNLVARTPHRSPHRFGEAVRSCVREHFDLDVPVVVRTPAQLAELVAWNPFPDDAATRPTVVQVLHLAAPPEPGRVAALLAEDWSPDEVVARGLEVVIRYAETMHRSRAQHASLTRRLGVDGTVRNWRTVQAVLDLAASLR